MYKTIIKPLNMKKNLLIIFLILSTSLFVSAQESVIEDVNYNQLEQLIEMAKANYPKNKIMALNEKKAKGAVPMEALSYLDMFNASYYYRPNDKSAINPENPYIFNGIQYGISLSLGSFLQKPFRIKEAKIDYEIAKLESMDYEKSLSLEVKNRYYLYILQLKELKLKTQAAQDFKGMADDIAIRFQRGEVELAEYNDSKTALSSANSAKIQTEVTYLIAKDQLEELIGKKLTELKGF
jgi:outer membrane protein TolC